MKREAAIAEHIAALENLCGEIERALLARDWGRFGQAMADSRRETHALQNAWELPGDDAESNERALARLRRVYTTRENQLARLRHYHHSVGEQIASIARFRSYARSIGAKRRPAPRSGSLDRLI